MMKIEKLKKSSRQGLFAKLVTDYGQKTMG
jgi:hypothetical protein